MGLFKPANLGKKIKCRRCGKTFYEVKVFRLQEINTLREYGFRTASVWKCEKCGKIYCGDCFDDLYQGAGCCGAKDFNGINVVEKKQ